MSTTAKSHFYGSMCNIRYPNNLSAEEKCFMWLTKRKSPSYLAFEKTNSFSTMTRSLSSSTPTSSLTSTPIAMLTFVEGAANNLASSNSSDIIPVEKSSSTSSKAHQYQDHRFNSYWQSSIDTQGLINSLIGDGLFTSSQAEALIVVAREILSERLNLYIIPVQQVETDAQMLKARCHEIRLELQIHSSKNATARKAVHERCTNEIQGTIEKLRDAVDILQTDARLRFSIFKGENREEVSKIDSSLHQKNSQLTLHMSDIKTFVEGIKVRLIFMFTSFLILAFLILVLEKNIRKKPALESNAMETNRKHPEYDSHSV